MARRCSLCNNTGHNSRTCTLRANASDMKKKSTSSNRKKTVNAKAMMPSTSNGKQHMRNWLDLPSDVTANILNRIGMVDIFKNCQRVCTAWHKICKDPAMWRVINMNDLMRSNSYGKTGKIMCKHAVDRSQGQLVDFTLEYDADLLEYVADRSSQLRRLELASAYLTSTWIKAVMKFPLLEELNVHLIQLSKEDIETVARYCPMLKTLKLNGREQKLQASYIDESSLKSYNETAIAIGQNLSELRHLELIGNNMTNIGLEAILDNCHHLETLDLRSCFNIVHNEDLKKKCVEKIKYLKFPNDSLEGYRYRCIPDSEYYEDYWSCGCDCGLSDTPEENRNFGNNIDDYDIDAYYDQFY
ncbi:hypothetical protein QVD17_36097 [Tagetes erecta]|uniref:F-box domain-containing protein n=1 Tax=Tagetes erecta TaxID=13708 RepID=A0AAD8JXX0_TARER|nr:hypothetical protein QVD17_36097 [Tagetes erecta]